MSKAKQAKHDRIARLMQQRCPIDGQLLTQDGVGGEAGSLETTFALLSCCRGTCDVRAALNLKTGRIRILSPKRLQTLDTNINGTVLDVLSAIEE